MIDDRAASLPIIIVNARVWTGDPRRPWADALALRDDRIEAVGAAPELRKRYGRAARVIDALGLTLLPAPGATAAPGGRADLVLLEQIPAGGPAATPDEADIVLRIEGGRVTVDRKSLFG